jgi:hypothetical protein
MVSDRCREKTGTAPGVVLAMTSCRVESGGELCHERICCW